MDDWCGRTQLIVGGAIPGLVASATMGWAFPYQSLIKKMLYMFANSSIF